MTRVIKSKQVNIIDFKGKSMNEIYDSYYNKLRRNNMSGGEYEYIQYEIDETALRIHQKAKDYEKTCDKKTIDRIIETAKILEKAAMMVQRVDWFVSCDDSEESFNKRWKEDEIDEIKIL